MTKLTKILTIHACTFALSLTIGCGKEGGGDGAGSPLDQLAEKACACADKKCLDDLEREAKEVVKAYEAEMKEKYKKKEDVPKEVMDAAQAAKKKARDCAEKIMKGN